MVKNSLAAWVKASRPKTLGAIACPVFIGSAFAFDDQHFSWLIFLTTLLCAVMMQILANLINDYGDFLRGSDSPHRLGPPRAMQMGWIDRPTMERGIIALTLMIVVLGSGLSFRGGWPILILGSLGLLLCAWYTLGSRPLAYVGFSEILIFFVFGPMASLATYYVQTLSFSSEALVGGLAPGFLSVALMLTNNLRDREEDTQHHKKTMAVRLGEKFSRAIIVFCVFLTLTSPAILYAFFSRSLLIWLSAMSLVFPVANMSLILREPISARFNLMLASIGKSLYVFGALISIGIIYGSQFISL